jgi:hypothetical protein
MIQIRIAIGMDTEAYSSLDKNPGIAGTYLPSRMPAAMQSNTQMVRYFSKKPMPSFFFI